MTIYNSVSKKLFLPQRPHRRGDLLKNLFTSQCQSLLLRVFPGWQRIFVNVSPFLVTDMSDLRPVLFVMIHPFLRIKSIFLDNEDFSIWRTAEIWCGATGSPLTITVRMLN